MLGVCPNGTVTVDWGDGTEPDVLTGTSVWTVKWTPVHNYAAAGDYIITLKVDGNVWLSGGTEGGNYSRILRYSSFTDGRNNIYLAAVGKVEIGKNTYLNTAAFFNCFNMRDIYLPDGSVQELNVCFANCRVLGNIDIPSGVSIISKSAFSNCHRMSRVSFGENVSEIQANAFYGCNGLTICDFSNNTTVPTLANINGFDGIPVDCEIRVPAALAEEWKAATNWSTYADYIVGV